MSTAEYDRNSSVCCCNKLGFSRYQIVIIVCLYSIGFMMFAPNQLFSLLANIPPTWRCDVDQGVEFRGGDNAPYGQNCTQYYECPPGNLSLAYEYYSLVVEFRMICDRSYLGSLIASIQMGGVMTGTIVGGQVADSFGRRRVLIFSFLGMSGCCLLSTIFPTWQLITGALFVVGFCGGAYILSLFTLIMESIQPHQRLAFKVLFHTWSISRLQTVGIAYLTNDWRVTYRIVNVAWLPLIGIGLYIAREPPRWLLQRNRMEEVEATLQHISRVNGDKHWKSVTAAIDHDAAKSHKGGYSYLHLFSSKDLRIRSYLACLFYLTGTTIGYATELQSGLLPGNFFTNQAIICSAMIIMRYWVFVLDYCAPGFKRRYLQQGTTLFLTILMFLLAILAAFNNYASKTATIVIFACASVIVEYYWDGLQLVSMELIPTVIRSRGYALAAIVGRTGSVITPQLMFLSTLWQPAHYLILTAIGMTNLISSCTLLPETKGFDLPDTLALQSVGVEAHKDGTIDGELGTMKNLSQK